MAMEVLQHNRIEEAFSLGVLSLRTGFASIIRVAFGQVPSSLYVSVSSEEEAGSGGISGLFWFNNLRVNASSLNLALRIP